MYEVDPAVASTVLMRAEINRSGVGCVMDTPFSEFAPNK